MSRAPAVMGKVSHAVHSRVSSGQNGTITCTPVATKGRSSRNISGAALDQNRSHASALRRACSGSAAFADGGVARVASGEAAFSRLSRLEDGRCMRCGLGVGSSARPERAAPKPLPGARKPSRSRFSARVSAIRDPRRLKPPPPSTPAARHLSSAFTVKNVGTSSVAEATTSRFRTNARAQRGSAAITTPPTPNTMTCGASDAARRDLVLTSAMNAAYRRRANLDAEATRRETATNGATARSRARATRLRWRASASRARARYRARRRWRRSASAAARAATSAAKPARTSALTRAGAFEIICTTRQRVARNSLDPARVYHSSASVAGRPARAHKRSARRVVAIAAANASRVVMGDASSSSARAPTSWTSRGVRASRTPRLRSSVASDASDASETRVASVASPCG